MFGLSLEHLLLAAVILVLFGPKRLPMAAAALGKAVRNFREQYKGMRPGVGVHEPEFRRLAEEPVAPNGSEAPHA